MARPTLMRHRKFLRLVAMLGSVHVARGVLEIMWDSAYESGDDRLGSVTDLELVVGWTGETGQLAHALVAAGFVDRTSDEDLRIHDLWHHAPDYVRKRRARELARQEQIDPVRRTAPNGGPSPPPSDCQTGDERTLALARAPSPAPAQKSGSSEPAAADSKPEPAVTSPAVLEFPTVGKGGSRWVLTQAQLDDWSELFPGVDVLAEARRALAWCDANPGRRKTAAGMPRFLVSWLGKAQDSGRGGRQDARQRFTPMAQPAYDDDWFEVCKRLHGGKCESRYQHGLAMAKVS